LQAVAPWDEETLHQGLQQLMAAEFLHQQGLPPQATYRFKHALIQEAAYQSLLRHTRRQYHQQIAQVLEAQFPETVAEQPELLAQHYTAAGLAAQAVVYRQRAGQQAVQRSANLEAIQHLTMGLQLLATLPETPTRAQQELEFQLALGPAFMAIKGFAASEVEQTYTRAWVLCQQVGGTLQLFPTLWGLYRSYLTRGALPKARELGEQLVRLAQREAAPTPRLEASEALGTALFHMGEYTAAWRYLRQGITLIDPAMQQAQTLHHGEAPGMRCLAVATLTLWCLGYPAQAVQRCQEALALAQALTHPHSLAAARYWAILLHYRRREVSAAQAQADALLTLATEHEFSLMVGHGTFWRGWARAMQGQSEVGLIQMHEGLTAILTTGQTV